MDDGFKPSTEPTGTTVFLRNESWVSSLRLIRLLIILAICALVALVCWLVGVGAKTTTPSLPPTDLPPAPAR